MKKGNAGKVLDINLSTKEIKEIELDRKIVQQYLGGLGLGVKIIYDQVGTKIDAFSEDNIIVLAPGPLSGTAAPSNGRTHVLTKSPITKIMGMGNFGGFWGPRLKKAGFEGVIIRGKSRNPVFIWIDDGNTKLIEADYLWGKDTYETTDFLKRDLGNDVSVLCIGQAGENLVKFACPIGDYYHAAGRSSVGCIMGDKKLKAIVVRGTKKVDLVDKIKFHEAVIEANDRIVSWPNKGEIRKFGCHSSQFKFNSKLGLLRSGNFATHELPEDHDFFHLPSSFEENVIFQTNSYGFNCMTAPYYGCEMEADISSGLYKGTKLGGIGFSYPAGEWGTRYGIKSYAAMFKCNELCNRYGMDGTTPIIFAIELLEKGIINKDDVDGLELRIGNEKAIIEMTRKIAYREGFGNILAEGVAEAARLIGKGADQYINTIKGRQMMQPNPRLYGMARNLGAITCTRGGDDLTSTHDISLLESFPYWASSELGWTKEQYLSWLIEYLDMFPEEKEKIYGSPPRVEFFNKESYEGKARLVVWFEHITSICNSLGTCTASSLMLPALGPTLLAKLYSTCTGLELKPRQLMKTGERIFNLMKAYNVRAGMTRKDDDYPARFYEEPITGGPFKGETMLSRENMIKMLDEYYEVRGWDIKTSIPTKEKLIELGLEDVVKTLYE
jgi:aldehyde:ferredoxin oxidoreductase